MKNIFSIHNPIGYIYLNRPHAKNALNIALMRELIQILSEIRNNPDIKAVCLQGENHYFCGGADLKEIKNTETTVEFAGVLSNLLDSLYQLPKPVIALVEGGAYGGGLGLLACCDIAIADKNAQFCFSEAKLGLIPAVISPYIIKAIGERTAKRYFLTAEIFDGVQAQKIGLIHEISEAENLITLSEYFLNLWVKNSTRALGKIKKLFSPVRKSKQAQLIQLLTKIIQSNTTQQRLEKFITQDRNEHLSNLNSR